MWTIGWGTRLTTSLLKSPPELSATVRHHKKDEYALYEYALYVDLIVYLHVDMPPILIFPEGTTTNGRYLGTSLTLLILMSLTLLIVVADWVV